MLITNLLALFCFLLGFALLVRAFRAAKRDTARYLRAAVGAMAAGAGNALLFKATTLGLLLLFVGVGLIVSASASQAAS